MLYNISQKDEKMNKDLIKIDDNHGYVSNDRGDINLVSKENDSHDFEEILSKENDLENLNSDLNNDEHELYSTKVKRTAAEI